MSEQTVQQRQAPKPAPAESRAHKAGPGVARLRHFAAALNGDSVRQLAPKKKLAQLSPKKKLAQLAEKRRTAQRRAKIASENVLQAVWVQSQEHLWHWDIPITGVRWFTDGLYYWFDVENQEGEPYHALAGIKNKHTHAEWKELGAGDLPEADLHYEAMHALMPTGHKDDVTWGPPTMNIGGEVHRLSKRNPFYLWLYQNKAPPTAMNCYEVVLYAAVRAGIRSKDYVKRQIELDPQEKIAGGPKLAKYYHPVQLTNKNLKEELGKLPAVIPRGWVVIFGPNGEHVALSAGITDSKGHQVLELDQKGNVEMRSIEEITLKYKWIGYGPLP